MKEVPFLCAGKFYSMVAKLYILENSPFPFSACVSQNVLSASQTIIEHHPSEKPGKAANITSCQGLGLVWALNKQQMFSVNRPPFSKGKGNEGERLMDWGKM